MKKYLISFAVLALGLASVTSCCDDDDSVQPPLAVVDFEGDGFSALIDNPQYGGSLLYSPDAYKWTDTNSQFSGECVKADWGDSGWGWACGPAISNYQDNDAATADYTHQLAVEKSNGSDNFAVLYGDGSAVSFADGKARVIRSMQVINTHYALGASWAGIRKSLADGYKFTVTVTADNGKTMDIDLAKDNTAIEEWTKVDLSSLGAVRKLTFTFDGTDKTSYDGGVTYYLNTPAYVAIDNIVIEK